MTDATLLYERHDLRSSAAVTRFALIGAAGYIAPRHLAAIKAVGGDLVAACDLHDSVGILDRYFPDAAFFQSPPAFYEHSRRKGIDYLVVCTPNHRHVDHTLAGFNLGADVICEKPLVLSSAETAALIAMEEATDQQVWVVQQLRLLPGVGALRQEIAAAALKIRVDPTRTLKRYSNTLPRYKVEISYVTRRGAWYHASWKGDPARSGGVAANIGAHLFDLVTWLFGRPLGNGIEVGETARSRIAGNLRLARADVEFLLSVDAADLPEGCEGYAHRVLTVDGEPLDLTPHFTNMHEAVYRSVLAGEGCGIADVLPGLRVLESVSDSSLT